jgi:hypothetical protein
VIICQDFILINNPKTGSTYARKIIKAVYANDGSLFKRALAVLGLSKRSLNELKHPNLMFPNRPKNQHGGYSQIPIKQKNRKILSIIRNPYDKLISAYEYKYYLQQRPDEELITKLQIKDLTKITLDDFILIQIADVKRRYPNLVDLQIGSQTIQFIFMFFISPDEVLKKLSENYFIEGDYKKDLGQIHFLNQTHLSEQLFEFLQLIGIQPIALEKAKSIEAINKNKNRLPIDKYPISETAVAYVDTYERFLLLMLRDLGFEFHRPSTAE